VESSACEGESWGYCGGGSTPTPAPAPAPAPTGWSVLSGSCSIDNDGCARSPNYPNSYPNNENCEIDAGQDSLPIHVWQFNTEFGFDFLTVNGVQYHGSNGPIEISATGTILWEADYVVTNAGWKLCPNGVPSPPPPLSAPPSSRRRFFK
jgi:hypothetical protein